MTVTIHDLQLRLPFLLKEISKTGEPLYVSDGADTFEIRPKPGKTAHADLSTIKRRPIIMGDPDDLVHIDWSREWRLQSPVT